MTSSRLVRGTKGRLFACLGVLTLFAGVLFLYHSTRVELDEVRNTASKCRQEQESLAAQLQVIFEYKVRLEKSLQQEKADHRATKDELQARMNDEQQLRDKENLENVNKYAALQQQYKLLQSQYEDLSEECGKVRLARDSCLDNLHQVQSQVGVIQQQLARRESEQTDEKARYKKLESENNDLKKKVMQLEAELKQNGNKLSEISKGNDASVVQQKKETTLRNRGSSTKEVDTGRANVADSGGGNQVGYLQQPPQKAPPAAHSSSTAPQDASKHSTTPQINPDALKSLERASSSGPAPPVAVVAPQAPAPFEARESNVNSPQGVLPAPLGFQNHNHYDSHASQQGARPLQPPFKHYLNAALHHQEVPANQGQIPPLAPMAVAAAGQSGVLQAPPEGLHEMIRNWGNINPVARPANPFRSDLVGIGAERPDIAQDGEQGIAANHGFGARHAARNHEQFGNLLDAPARGNELHAFVADVGNDFEQNQGVVRQHPVRERDEDVNQIAPLEGDVNQHVFGGKDLVAEQFHQRNAAIAHHHMGLNGRQNNARGNGAHEMPHNLHYNYQGGDYDKEEHQAQDDEDVDQLDYNEAANQAQPALPKAGQQRFPEQQRHQEGDGVMVNPR